MPSGPAGPTASNGSSAKVLVIDDSNTIRRSAEIFLRQGGHEVVLAEDGFDALAKVNDHDPELIFCDILMPRLDGYQTCAIIKRNPRFAHVPVIMLSSKDGLFDKARGRMVGSEEYLTKPFTKEQLLRAVESFRRAPVETANHPAMKREALPCRSRRSSSSTTARPNCTTCRTCWASAATPCARLKTAKKPCAGSPRKRQT
jgi:twitching motility two-component system response regulator PilG